MFESLYKSRNFHEIIKNFELDSNVFDYNNDDIKCVIESYVNLQNEDKAISILSSIIEDSKGTSYEHKRLRRLVYDTYIQQKKYDVTIDTLRIFELIIQNSTSDEDRLNIVFHKQAIKFIKAQSKINYGMLLKWLLLFPVFLLNDTPYGNQKYSDSDLYYYERFKCYCELEMIEEARQHYSDMISKIKSIELIDFVKYNMCKALFALNEYEEANVILQELLLYQRHKYYLYLPIKHMFTDKTLICKHMLELLSIGIQRDEQYVFKYIIDWIAMFEHPYYMDQIKNQISYDDKWHISIESKKEFLKKIEKFCRDYLGDSINEGIVVNITKTGHAFIKSEAKNKTVFISSKYAKKVKLNQRVEYISFDSYDKSKNIISSAGFILGGI